jgi:putative thioredoxin
MLDVNEPGREVTESSLEQDVYDRSVETPVVLVFHAEWCAPCRSLGPKLDKLAHDRPGAFSLARVNVDAEPALVKIFKVRTIPAVFGIRNRQVVDSFKGDLEQPELIDWLEGWIDRPFLAEQNS